MARNQISKSRRKGNPLLTRNGKVRLGPLSVAKLTEMLSSSIRLRDKDKIERAIKYRAANG
jgi:hypothetical protein